jgi:cholesterol transport system auxiliary component
MMAFSRRTVLMMSASASLSGCGAVAAVSRASEPRDTYTLSALAPTGARASGTSHLVIETPTSGGELSTDRILIKVSPLQAEYLPDARWSEQTPAMVQTLMINSTLNRGGFRLVTRVGAGLMPDYTLMTEIQAFQAELTGPEADGVQVRITLHLSLIREEGRSIVGTRTVTTVVQAPSDASDALVAALDRAMLSVMGEAVMWLQDLT